LHLAVSRTGFGAGRREGINQARMRRTRGILKRAFFTFRAISRAEFDRQEDECPRCSRLRRNRFDRVSQGLPERQHIVGTGEDFYG
jgi:hypothetical protein